ncbi:hypothetical protein GCM10009747_00110 [Agromyces humatus]|uniref:Uncharacterized protein n=1 Tax=Agromyces humatus TaxID=279573 RepID=A0ABN2K2L3_9MICO
MKHVVIIVVPVCDGTGGADMVDPMSAAPFAASARHPRVVELRNRRRGGRRISATSATA